MQIYCDVSTPIVFIDCSKQLEKKKDVSLSKFATIDVKVKLQGCSD